MPCAAWDRHCFNAGRVSSACCLSYCCTAASVPAKEMHLHPRHQPRKDRSTHTQHAPCSCSSPLYPAVPARWLPLPHELLPLQSEIPTQHPHSSHIICINTSHTSVKRSPSLLHAPTPTPTPTPIPTQKPYVLLSHCPSGYFLKSEIRMAGTYTHNLQGTVYTEVFRLVEGQAAE